MAAAFAVKEALWIRKLLPDLGIKINVVCIMCDNQGTIKLLKNPVASNRSKHIFFSGIAFYKADKDQDKNKDQDKVKD